MFKKKKKIYINNLAYSFIPIVPNIEIYILFSVGTNLFFREQFFTISFCSYRFKFSFSKVPACFVQQLMCF